MRAPLPSSLVVVALCATLSAAQSPAPSSPSQPVFRSGVTLVEVSAIVTRDGVPVDDLRADEITILDNGKPQPVVVFERVDLTDVEGPAQRRDFVLVLDDLHIEPANSEFAQRAALALIDALGPHDRLAIVNTAADDLTMEFGTDRAAARALVRRARGQAPPMRAPVVGRGPSLDGEVQEPLFRARGAMQVLSEVAAAIRGDSSERRTMFIVSEGHRMPWQTMRLDDHPGAFLDYLNVLREATTSNLAIYAVDPRGLQAPRVAAEQRQAGVPPVSQAVLERFGSLGLLADGTGGVLTVWTNDLAAGIPQMLRDSRRYYRIAYAQPEVGSSRSARKIEVKVARPGVEVRARKQYVPGTPS